MTEWSERLLEGVTAGLEALADPERSAAMARYMRDKFTFHGVASPDRKRLLGQAATATSAELGPPRATDIEAFARGCYEESERELHYVGVGAARLWQKLLGPDHITLLHHLVVTHSWWDTVDELASHVAGGLVSRYPEISLVMDDWVESENMWVARTAILHQLRFENDTDADRLFRYCLLRAHESDFFYRKAIGWSLRQYARTDPDAVRRFCADHAHDLSPLSLREATKHL